MQDKELEKILQEKADEKPLREFSEVWEEIKDQVTAEEKPPKRFKFKKWFPLMLTSAVLIVCLAFTPLIIESLKPPVPEEVYYSDELSVQKVAEDEMIDGLLQSSITHVDLVGYILESCNLLVTEDNVVKGAFFRVYNNPPTFFANVKIYDKDVDLNTNYSELYSETCKINDTDVYYQFVKENSGLQEYNVYAVHNNVQYVMQYTGMPDSLIQSLTDFFE